MHFKADAGGLRRAADHLAQLRRPGRQEFEPPVAFRQAYELRRLVRPMPEVLPHRGEDPHQTRAHETGQKLDEPQSLAERYAITGEELLELIDDENEFCSLVLQHAARLTRLRRELAECGADRIARLHRGIAQMGSKHCG